jgi:hypothetical protein
MDNGNREKVTMTTRTHYEERSGWAWWVHGLVGLTFLAAAIPLFLLATGGVGDAPGQMSLSGAAVGIVFGLALPGFIYGFFGQLRTRVTDTGLEIRWGVLEILRKKIPFSAITKAEAVTYSPLGQFGGWGIRYGGSKKKAWTIRGNRALKMTLEDGTQFYLGSDRPERILSWVTPALKRSKG